MATSTYKQIIGTRGLLNPLRYFLGKYYLRNSVVLSELKTDNVHWKNASENDFNQHPGAFRYLLDMRFANDNQQKREFAAAVLSSCDGKDLTQALQLFDHLKPGKHKGGLFAVFFQQDKQRSAEPLTVVQAVKANSIDSFKTTLTNCFQHEKFTHRFVAQFYRQLNAEDWLSIIKANQSNEDNKDSVKLWRKLGKRWRSRRTRKKLLATVTQSSENITAFVNLLPQDDLALSIKWLRYLVSSTQTNKLSAVSDYVANLKTNSQLTRSQQKSLKKLLKKCPPVPSQPSDSSVVVHKESQQSVSKQQSSPQAQYTRQEVTVENQKASFQDRVTQLLTESRIATQDVEQIITSINNGEFAVEMGECVGQAVQGQSTVNPLSEKVVNAISQNEAFRMAMFNTLKEQNLSEEKINQLLPVLTAKLAPQYLGLGKDTSASAWLDNIDKYPYLIVVLNDKEKQQELSKKIQADKTLFITLAVRYFPREETEAKRDDSFLQQAVKDLILAAVKSLIMQMAVSSQSSVSLTINQLVQQSVVVEEVLQQEASLWEPDTAQQILPKLWHCFSENGRLKTILTFFDDEQQKIMANDKLLLALITLDDPKLNDFICGGLLKNVSQFKKMILSGEKGYAAIIQLMLQKNNTLSFSIDEFNNPHFCSVLADHDYSFSEQQQQTMLKAAFNNPGFYQQPFDQPHGQAVTFDNGTLRLCLQKYVGKLAKNPTLLFRETCEAVCDNEKMKVLLERVDSADVIKLLKERDTPETHVSVLLTKRVQADRQFMNELQQLNFPLPVYLHLLKERKVREKLTIKKLLEKFVNKTDQYQIACVYLNSKDEQVVKGILLDEKLRILLVDLLTTNGYDFAALVNNHETFICANPDVWKSILSQNKVFTAKQQALMIHSLLSQPMDDIEDTWTLYGKDLQQGIAWIESQFADEGEQGELARDILIKGLPQRTALTTALLAAKDQQKIKRLIEFDNRELTNSLINTVLKELVQRQENQIGEDEKVNTPLFDYLKQLTIDDYVELAKSNLSFVVGVVNNTTLCQAVSFTAIDFLMLIGDASIAPSALAKAIKLQNTRNTSLYREAYRLVNDQQAFCLSKEIQTKFNEFFNSIDGAASLVELEEKEAVEEEKPTDRVKDAIQGWRKQYEKKGIQDARKQTIKINGEIVNTDIYSKERKRKERSLKMERQYRKYETLKDRLKQIEKFADDTIDADVKGKLYYAAAALQTAVFRGDYQKRLSKENVNEINPSTLIALRLEASLNMFRLFVKKARLDSKFTEYYQYWYIKIIKYLQKYDNHDRKTELLKETQFAETLIQEQLTETITKVLSNDNVIQHLEDASIYQFVTLLSKDKVQRIILSSELLFDRLEAANECPQEEKAYFKKIRSTLLMARAPIATSSVSPKTLVAPPPTAIPSLPPAATPIVAASPILKITPPPKKIDPVVDESSMTPPPAPALASLGLADTTQEVATESSVAPPPPPPPGGIPSLEVPEMKAITPSDKRASELTANSRSPQGGFNPTQVLSVRLRPANSKKTQNKAKSPSGAASLAKSQSSAGPGLFRIQKRPKILQELHLKELKALSQWKGKADAILQKEASSANSQYEYSNFMDKVVALCYDKTTIAKQTLQHLCDLFNTKINQKKNVPPYGISTDFWRFLFDKKTGCKIPEDEAKHLKEKLANIIQANSLKEYEDLVEQFCQMPIKIGGDSRCCIEKEKQDKFKTDLKTLYLDMVPGLSPSEIAAIKITPSGFQIPERGLGKDRNFNLFLRELIAVCNITEDQVMTKSGSNITDRTQQRISIYAKKVLLLCQKAQHRQQLLWPNSKNAADFATSVIDTSSNSSTSSVHEQESASDTSANDTPRSAGTADLAGVIKLAMSKRRSDLSTQPENQDDTDDWSDNSNCSP